MSAHTISKRWMEDEQLKGIQERNKEVYREFQLNGERSAEDQTYMENRVALFKSWEKNYKFDKTKTWATATAAANKIKMALEAHDELGWSLADFDNRLNNICVKARMKKKRQSNKVVCSIYYYFYFCYYYYLYMYIYIYIHR